MKFAAKKEEAQKLQFDGYWAAAHHHDPQLTQCPCLSSLLSSLAFLPLSTFPPLFSSRPKPTRGSTGGTFETSIHSSVRRAGDMSGKEMQVLEVVQEQVAKERKMFPSSSCGIALSKALTCALTPGKVCHADMKDEFKNVDKLMSCYLNMWLKYILTSFLTKSILFLISWMY